MSRGDRCQPSDGTACYRAGRPTVRDYVILLKRLFLLERVAA